ncbi:hypothetical protein AHAS_Ahas07G0116400 [Arachis hypogaea]
MVQLAKAYDVDTSTLKVNFGNIHISAKLIGKALGIPSSGADFSELDRNAAHVAIKARFQKIMTTQLCNFVHGYPMETETKQMDFR